MVFKFFYIPLYLGVIALICVWPGAELMAGSDMLRVVVEQEKPEDEARSEDLVSTLRTKGFAQAGLKKSRSLLPGELDPDREQALLNFLQSETDQFVLSYSEQELKQENQTLRMPLAVKINVWALRDLLKSWGTYYTADVDWEYSLQLTGPTANQDMMLLHELQAITGVSRKNTGFPRLVLEHDPDMDSRWQAELRTEDSQWSSTGDELRKVWYSLWSQYFGQSSVQERVVQEMVLQVQGWSAVSGVWAFDQEISGWDQITSRPDIINMDFSPGHVQAIWSIKTRQEKELRQRIEQELLPRGLNCVLLKADQYRASYIPAQDNES